MIVTEPLLTDFHMMIFIAGFGVGFLIGIWISKSLSLIDGMQEG